MRKLLLMLVVFVASASAQSATMTLAGPNTIPLGKARTFTLAITNGGSPAAFQFTIAASATDISAITATASTNVTGTPGKTITCGPFTAGTMICLVYGLNASATTTIPDGTDVNLSITASSTTTNKTTALNVSGLEATPAGGGITVTAGPSLSISLSVPCDLNGDGLVNAADVTAAVNQVDGTSPVTSCDVNGDGACNVLDVQVEAIAASGGTCQAK